jgi:hypothetical protein
MRSISFIVLVGVMIVLFAFTFYVLGKGDYQPQDPGEGRREAAAPAFTPLA